MEIDWTLALTDDGYEVMRNGEVYDQIPFDLIRIFVGEEALLESYLGGEYAHQTNNMPPAVES